MRRRRSAGLVRFLREYEDLYKARKDPRLTQDAQTYMENLHTYHADRLRRIEFAGDAALLVKISAVRMSFW